MTRLRYAGPLLLMLLPGLAAAPLLPTPARAQDADVQWAMVEQAKEGA